MMIKVVSRAEAEQWNPLGVPHVIISIHTPPDDRANPATNEYTLEVLHLGFHDLDRSPGFSWRLVYGEPVLFGWEMAGQIVSLLRRHAGIEAVLVHCDAGQSRSAGVGAAIAYCYGGDEREFFATPSMYPGAQTYCPNMLVYRTLLSVLLSEGTRRKE